MPRGVTFDVKVELITEECCNCGILFGIPSDLRVRRRRDHQTFYCPNGHGQSYSSESAEERLKREMQEAEERHKRDLRSEIERRLRAETAAMDLANSNRALKGVATKLKRRAAAGVCPACHRTISQMSRHMATKHPGYCAEPGAPA